MYDKTVAERHLRIDHIPDEHLKGIGQVSMSWAYLEGGIERLIWRYADLTDNEGIAVTTHLNMPMRLDILNSLIELKYSDSFITKEIKKISKHIRNNLAPLRNEILHSRILYLTEVQIAFRATYKARGKIQKNTKPIEVSEYKDVMNQIMETANKIYIILSSFDQQILAEQAAASVAASSDKSD